MTVADPIFRIYRTPRTLGMGGVYTAVPQDEQVFFGNPGGFGRGEFAGGRSFGLDFTGLQVGTSSATINLITDIRQTEGSFEDIIIKAVDYIGAPFGLGASYFPNFAYKYFGLGILVNLDTSFKISNPSYPELGVFASPKAVAVLGGGFPLFNKALNIGVSLKGGAITSAKETVSAAFIGKIEDLQSAFPVVGTGPSNIFTKCLNPDANINIYPLECRIGVWGDIGAVYNFKVKHSPSVGLSVRNIGLEGTNYGFTTDLGFALRPKTGYVKTTLGLDFQDILFRNSPDTDILKRTNLGAEFEILSYRFLNIAMRTGFNQTYFSVGLGLKIGILKLDLATYAEEIGPTAGILPERRYILYISVLNI